MKSLPRHFLLPSTPIATIYMPCLGKEGGENEPRVEQKGENKIEAGQNQRIKWVKMGRCGLDKT